MSLYVSISLILLLCICKIYSNCSVLRSCRFKITCFTALLFDNSVLYAKKRWYIIYVGIEKFQACCHFLSCSLFFSSTQSLLSMQELKRPLVLSLCRDYLGSLKLHQTKITAEVNPSLRGCTNPTGHRTLVGLFNGLICIEYQCTNPVCSR